MPPDRKIDDIDMTAELARLADEVARLNQHRFVRIHNSIWRLILWQFVRGLALGLGTAVGATALVSAVVILLGQIEFIPILGDLAGAIINEIDVKADDPAAEIPKSAPSE